MLKGLCRQREKDKEQEKKEELKRQEEQRILAKQKQAMRLAKEVNAMKTELPTNLQEIKSELEKHMNVLENNIKALKRVATRLGVPLANIVNSELELKEKKEEILQAITASSQMVSKGKDGKFNEEEYWKLQAYESNVNMSRIFVESLPQKSQKYKEACLKDIKSNLNEKVQNLIYKSEVAKLQQEKRDVINEKETILKRILGIKELKQAKIQNIDAKIRLAAVEKYSRNPQKSVNEMIQEMYDCAYKHYDGKLTPEMEEMEANIRKNFKGLIDCETMKKQAIKRNQNKSLMIVDNKPRIRGLFSNRKKAHEIEQNTNQIRSKTYEAEGMKINNVRQNLELPNANEKLKKALNNIKEKVSYIKEEGGSNLQEKVTEK